MKKGEWQMDYKNPENIMEFLKFQKSILKKYLGFLKNTMATNYKRSAIFVYWLNDYIEYIKQEHIFNPAFNITYKRGQIIFVNFGFRIGSELGGNHYAVVLDVKNSKQSKTLLVVPLKSKKEKPTKYSQIYHIPLGNCVKHLLYNKATLQYNDNFTRIMTLAKQPSISVQNPSAKDLAIFKRESRMARRIKEYSEKLKAESIADIGQITTISKQRIIHPCKTNDVLTGILLPDELLKAINAKLQHLYATVDNH